MPDPDLLVQPIVQIWIGPAILAHVLIQGKKVLSSLHRLYGIEINPCPDCQEVECRDRDGSPQVGDSEPEPSHGNSLKGSRADYATWRPRSIMVRWRGISNSSPAPMQPLRLNPTFWSNDCRTPPSGQARGPAHF